METQKKASVEELAEKRNPHSHWMSGEFISGYNEAAKALKETQELNESIMQTNTAMGKRLLVYEQALKEVSQSSDAGSYEKSIVDMKKTAYDALKLPCDFTMPYSEDEVLAIIERVKFDEYAGDNIDPTPMPKWLNDSTAVYIPKAEKK